MQISYGSSGVFYSQILNGAPYDIYLSGDIDYPRRLGEDGLLLDDNVFTYAVGRLALWARADAHLDVAGRGLEALTDPAVGRIAIANPRHAPYGRAAEGALRSLGLYDAVSERLVLGENVSQALQFVQSRAADIGFVALALALAPDVQKEGDYWQLPLDANAPLVQGGAVLKSARNPDGALALRRLMLSDRGSCHP